MLKTPLVSLNYSNWLKQCPKELFYVLSQFLCFHGSAPHLQQFAEAWWHYLCVPPGSPGWSCLCVCKLCWLGWLPDAQTASSEEFQGAVVVVANPCQCTFLSSFSYIHTQRDPLTENHSHTSFSLYSFGWKGRDKPMASRQGEQGRRVRERWTQLKRKAREF